MTSQQGRDATQIGTNVNNPDGFQDVNNPGSTTHQIFFFYEQIIAVGGNNNKTDVNVNIAVALGFTDTTAKRQRAQ